MPDSRKSPAVCQGFGSRPSAGSDVFNSSGHAVQMFTLLRFSYCKTDSALWFICLPLEHVCSPLGPGDDTLLGLCDHRVGGQDLLESAGFSL